MFFQSILSHLEAPLPNYPVLVSGKAGSSTYVKTFDGINWTTSDYNNANAPLGLVGKNGLWLRYGGAGVIARSINYVNWTVFASPFGGNAQSLTFNNIDFLLYKSATANISISTDSVNWTAGTLPVAGSWLTPIWNGSYWLAVLPNSTTAAKSIDGINWTASTLPASNNWKTPIWNGTYWLVITTSTPAAVSTDGINWTAVTTTLNGGALWSTPIWTGSAWWSYDTSASPYRVAGSYDGVNWFVTATPWTSSYTVNIVNIGGVLMANVGLTSTINTDGTNTVSISTDYGVNWSTPITMTAGYKWDNSKYVNGIYYKFALQSGGSTRLLATTTDGVNWIYNTLPTEILAIGISSEPIVFWNGKYFMLEGGSAIIATTTDLINWTRTILPTSGTWRGLQKPSYS